MKKRVSYSMLTFIAVITSGSVLSVTGASAQPVPGQVKLNTTQLKECLAREKTIVTLLTRIAERSQKELELSSSIYQETERFYKEKVKPASNYNTLAKDVAAKKAGAQLAVSQLKTIRTKFNCWGNDPKGIVAQFKDVLKREQVVQKELKDSVKRLIAGVKAAQGRP